AGLERGHERALLVVALRVDVDLPLPVELPGDGAARAEGAAVLVHREAEIRDGPVRVVGQRLDIERSTAMAVPLVRDLLVLDALELARALLDGALDVLRGHVRGLRRVDGEAQPRIHPRIAATGTRRDRDLADQLRELLPPTSVVDRLLALDLRPFAVSCHGRTSSSSGLLPDGCRCLTRWVHAPNIRAAEDAKQRRCIDLQVCTVHSDGRRVRPHRAREARCSRIDPALTRPLPAGTCSAGSAAPQSGSSSRRTDT